MPKLDLPVAPTQGRPPSLLPLPPARLAARAGLAALLAGVLAACSGGGGGGSGPSAPSGLAYTVPAPVYVACAPIAGNAPSITGSVTAWSIEPELTAGLVFDTASGLISGTPSAVAAPLAHTVTAVGPGGSTSVEITIAVEAPPAPAGLGLPKNLVWAYDGLPIEPLVPTLEVGGGTFRVEPALPAGLSVDPLSGVISGSPRTPAAAQTFTLLVEDCLGGEDQVQFELAVFDTQDLTAERLVFTLGEDGVLLVHGLRADGVLAALGTRPLGLVPADLAPAWTERHLLVLGAEPETLAVWAFDPIDGRLAAGPAATFDFGADTNPGRLLVDRERGVVYASLTGADRIAALALAADGTLAPLAGSPFEVLGDGQGAQGPGALALTPSGEFLLVANGLSGSVSSFRLDPDGELSDEVSATVGGSPGALVTLPGDGAAAFAALVDEGASELQLHPIDPLDGSLGALSDSVALPPDGGPFALAASADGAMIYVAGEYGGGPPNTLVRVAHDGLGGVAGPSITGDLGPQGSPLGLVIGRSGTRFLMLFAEPAELAVLELDGVTGELEPASALGGGIPTNRARTRPAPRVLAVAHGPAPLDLGTDFVYVANRADADVSQFAFDGAQGDLSALVPPTEPTGPLPNRITVHPFLERAYVAHVGPNFPQLSTLRIRSDGSLAPWDELELELAGNSIFDLVVSRCGGFLFGTESTAGEVLRFGLDAEGRPTFLGAVDAGEVPRGLALSPNGAFLYVAAAVTGRVLAFRVDPEGGELEPIPFADPDESSGPAGLVIDPTGRFLYRINTLGATLFGYGIDPEDGTLSPLQGTPIELPVGSEPQFGRVDPLGRILYVSCTAVDEVHRWRINLVPDNAVVDGSLIGLPLAATMPLPRQLLFADAGGHLVIASESGEVRVYAADSSQSGALTLTDTEATGATSIGVGARTRPR